MLNKVCAYSVNGRALESIAEQNLGVQVQGSLKVAIQVDIVVNMCLHWKGY